MIKIILLIIIIYIICQPKTEKFSLLNVPEPTCNNCYNKTLKQCLECENCGISDYKCIPGDENGPFFDYKSHTDWVWKDHKHNQINNSPQIIYSKNLKLPNYIDSLTLSRLGL